MRQLEHLASVGGATSMDKILAWYLSSSSS